MISPKGEHLSFASASAIQGEDLETTATKTTAFVHIFLSRNVVNVVLDVTKNENRVQLCVLAHRPRLS